MDTVHAHLILNHIPSIGVGAAAFLLLYGLLKKSDEVIKATFCGIVAIALITIAVYLTGKAAEDTVEHLPGVSESFIERHEDAGLIALVSIEILGLFALGGLFLSRRRGAIPRGFTALALGLCLVAGGVAAWTSNRGGQIRHTEIRGSGVSDQTEDENEDAEENDDEGGGRRRSRGRGGDRRQ